MKTITIATFDTLAPAQLLQERLRKAQCQTVIHDESGRERYRFLSRPLAAFHVQVEPSGYAAACQLLAELDAAEGILLEAVRCPECGSSRIEYPQITRKFLMPALETLLMVAHIIPRRFYCQHCHFTWPAKQEEVPQRDVLGWKLDSKFWHPERFKDRA